MRLWFIGDAKLKKMRVKDGQRMQSTTHGDGLTIDFWQNSKKPPLIRGVGGINPDFCNRSNRPTPAIFQANRLSTGRGFNLAVICGLPDIGE